MGHNFSFCQTCETPLDCDFCDKLAELMEPGHMTLEELKAEAKRQGYKLIKDENIRAELGVSGGLGRRGTRWFAYDVDWKAPGCPGAKGKTV